MLLQNSTPSSRSKTQGISHLSQCSLTWLDRQLLVQAVEQTDVLPLAALNDFSQVVECLKRSPIEVVKLDRKMGTLALKTWIEACSLAGKACYITIESPISDEKSPALGRGPSVFSRWLSQVYGLCSLLVLSPIAVMNMLALALKGYSIGLKQEWACDQRGRVLSLINFKLIRTALGSVPDISPKISPIFVKLAQSLNVLRGEVNIFIAPPRNLESGLESGLI
jgi:hypothetical protein